MILLYVFFISARACITTKIRDAYETLMTPGVWGWTSHIEFVEVDLAFEMSWKNTLVFTLDYVQFHWQLNHFF